MKPLLLLLAFVSLDTIAHATVVPEFAAGVAINDPLQDSHLIVRGYVSEIRAQRITLAQLGLVPPSDRTAQRHITVSTVALDVEEVLKGRSPAKAIELLILDDQSFVRSGQEYVFCARWLVVNGVGSYVSGSHIAVYLARSDGTWEQLSGSEPRSVLTDHDLRGRIRGSDLPSVTALSDVVVRGIVKAKWLASYDAGTGRVGVMQHFRVEVTEGFKGANGGDDIEFVVPQLDGASYLPPWTRHTPPDISVGEEWFALLRRENGWLAPFAGPNSLLKVAGETVLYDSSVPYSRSTRQTLDAIRAEVSNANE